ncbi:hypothetical protein EV121DRAFT_292156 [Schizophyllum commune]
MEKLERLHFDDLLSNEVFLEKMILRKDKPALLPTLTGVAIWRVFWDNLDLHDIIKNNMHNPFAMLTAHLEFVSLPVPSNEVAERFAT